MPRKRQIRFLQAQTLADGTTVWHWKPSPRLRKAGWVNKKLGHDETAAIMQAMEQNRAVEEWEKGTVLAPAVAAPRVIRFRELIGRYQASERFTQLAPKSRAEYASRLRWIEAWAKDGALAVRDCDGRMVKDLRDTLVRGASKHKAAAILRVLRILMGFAKEEFLIRENPAQNIRIPEPPSRTRILTMDAIDALYAQAMKLDLPSMALAIRLAFWTLQRQGDVIQLTAMSRREIDDLDPRDRAILADPKGRVFGFRLRQNKTATWIDAPIPPVLHGEVDEALKRSQWVVGDDNNRSRAYPSFLFQRRFRKVAEAAFAAARDAGNAQLVAQLTNIQFRDLRRTGMCFYGDLGVPPNLITALSGHAVLGKKSILDTYMPGNTRSACACVAMALRRMAERDGQEKGNEG